MKLALFGFPKRVGEALLVMGGFVVFNPEVAGFTPLSAAV